jgi:hypothetical protein
MNVVKVEMEDGHLHDAYDTELDWVIDKGLKHVRLLILKPLNDEEYCCLIFAEFEENGDDYKEVKNAPWFNLYSLEIVKTLRKNLKKITKKHPDCFDDSLTSF